VMYVVKDLLTKIPSLCINEFILARAHMSVTFVEKTLVKSVTMHKSIHTRAKPSSVTYTEKDDIG